MGTWLRQPGTQQEKRKWFEYKELCREYPELKRTNRRSPHELVDFWDDIIREDQYDRSWKRHRRTQYKDKACHERKLPHLKVTYDSPWTLMWPYWKWTIRFHKEKKIQFRVRLRFRKHKVPNGRGQIRL